METRLKLELR